MQITVAIVEDDKNAQDQLHHAITEYCATAQLGVQVTCFENGKDFLDAINRSFDIVFMDIEMPQLDGMQAAQQMRQLGNTSILVFVTNLAQFAIQGYHVQASDYIIKPFHTANLRRAIGRAIARRQALEATHTIATRSETIQVNLRDITYIESVKHKLQFHVLDTQVLQSSGTLTELMEELRVQGFTRIHKAIIVNIRHLKSISGNEAILSDGSHLPIGRYFKQQVVLDIARYQSK